MKLRINSFFALACGLGVCLAHAGEVHYESGHFYIFDFGDGTGVRCHTYQFRGSFEGSVHRYSAGGDCSVSAEGAHRYPDLPPVDPTRIHTKHIFQLVGQFDARTGRTTELMKFPVPQTDKYRTATVVELEMRCPIDPWLGPPGDWFFYPDQWWRQNSCAVVRLETRGNLLSARGVSELMRRGFVDSNPRRPFTAGTLHGDTIVELRDALAQAEQAARTAAITKATTGKSPRDASLTRQGSYNPASSLRDASPTRAGAVATPRTSAMTTAAASAPTTPSQVPPPPPLSLGQPPRIDIPNFGSIAPNLPAHVTASTSSQAASAATDTRGSPQRSGTATDGPTTRSTTTRVPGSTPPPTPDVGTLGWPSWAPQLPGQGAGAPPPATPSSRSTTIALPAGLAASSVGTTRSAPASVQRAQPVALRIVAPSPNSDVRQGQLRVQAALSGAGTSRDAEIEFVHLSSSGAANPAQWTVPMDQLAQGVAVPLSAGPRSSGRWQMRVRPAGAAATAWSEPVTFDYVALSDSRAKAWGKQATEFERRGLNPQPLPPREGTARASTFQR